MSLSIPLHAYAPIRVAGHLGVRLPASPPRAHTCEPSDEVFIEIKSRISRCELRRELGVLLHADEA